MPPLSHHRVQSYTDGKKENFQGLPIYIFSFFSRDFRSLDWMTALSRNRRSDQSLRITGRLQQFLFEATSSIKIKSRTIVIRQN
jgi:hypothetical protein